MTSVFTYFLFLGERDGFGATRSGGVVDWSTIPFVPVVPCCCLRFR